MKMEVVTYSFFLKVIFLSKLRTIDSTSGNSGMFVLNEKLFYCKNFETLK